MTLTAVVQKLDEKRYRATLSSPIQMESEGTTAAEAVAELRRRTLEKLKDSELVEFRLPDESRDNPWVRMAGIWKDNPDIEEYTQAIEEYRRECDARESD